MARRFLHGRYSHTAVQSNEEEKAGRRPLKRFTGIAVVLLVFVFLFFGYRYTQSPAEGVVGNTKPDPSGTQSVSTTKIDSKYFTLEHPGYYTAVRSADKKVTPPTLETYGLGARLEMESRRLNVTVKQSPPSLLRDESALAFRQNNPDYISSEEEVGGQPAKKMVKKDGSEITYFVPGPNAYAIIATTSTLPGTDYEQEVGQVIKTFRWK
jgi:hypothetical protein